VKKSYGYIFLFILTSILFFSKISYQTSNFAIRLFLTKAIANEGTVVVDHYIEPFLKDGFVDKAYYNGHYYCDKPPGSSLMMLPQFLLIGRPVEWLLKGRYSPERVDRFVAWVVRISSLGVYSALTVVFWIKIAELLFGSLAAHKTIWALFFGTPMFAYSIFATGEMYATFCLVVGFYYLLRSNSPLNACLAGFLFGLAILTARQSLLIILCIDLYAIFKYRKWRFILILALPQILFMFLDLAFNKISVGSWFTPVYLYHPPGLANPDKDYIISALKFSNILSNLWFRTFHPNKGMLFYSPFLLFVISGLIVLIRKDRALARLFMCTILAFTGFLLCLREGEGGPTFALRYSLSVIPFMGLTVCAARPWERYKMIWYLSIGVSMFMCCVAAITVVRYSNVMVNPFTEFYIPYLFKHGPNNLICQFVGEFLLVCPSFLRWISTCSFFVVAIGMWKIYMHKLQQP
jgi:hypothetical protein